MVTAGGSFKGGFFGCFGAIAALIVLVLAVLILPSLLRERSARAPTANDVTPFCQAALASAISQGVDVAGARIGPAQPYRMGDNATCFFEQGGEQITVRMAMTCSEVTAACVRVQTIERGGEVIYSPGEPIRP